MRKQVIATINGVEIFAVDNDGDILVPIRPICQALGIDDKRQREKIQDDEILSSVGGLKPSTGADGKTYEMFVLPLKFVYGWLFTINPKNVSSDAKEAVARYRRDCYEVLYEHFTVSMARTIETNNAEIALLKEINDALTTEKEAKAKRRKLEQTLTKLRNERLNPQQVLPL